jgi:ketosteroid isomerase-like protein
MNIRSLAHMAVLSTTLATLDASAGADDARIIADLDTQYQAAVERSDWQTMDKILHPDFVLVLGNGRQYTREQLIESTRKRNVAFEKQVEIAGTQAVRLFGDTATVTAFLWCKGKRNDDQSAFDYKLWFTDTYVRTSKGWLYAFGQASLPVPNDE